MTEDVRAVVGLAVVFRLIPNLSPERSLARLLYFVVSLDALFWFFLLNGKVMVLRSCVELVKHTLLWAQHQHLLRTLFLASSLAQVIISGLTLVDKYLIFFLYF